MKNIIERSKPLSLIDVQQLKYLQLNYQGGAYIATLTDTAGDAVLKGYGASILEAINDLHHNLI